MMGSIDWYNEAIDVNGYSAEHHPEFLYISFPRRVSKREGEMIELYNRAWVTKQRSFTKREQ